MPLHLYSLLHLYSPLHLYSLLHLYLPLQVHPVSYAQETDSRVQGVQEVKEDKVVQEVQQVTGDHEVTRVPPVIEEVTRVPPVIEEDHREQIVHLARGDHRIGLMEGVAVANRKKRERIKNNEVYHISITISFDSMTVYNKQHEIVI